MAMREVLMCDRTFDGKPCDRISEATCGVCRQDVCHEHRMSEDLALIIDSHKSQGAYQGWVPFGPICKRCAQADTTKETKASIRQLFTPLKEQLLEILRAQQTAEALK